MTEAQPTAPASETPAEEPQPQTSTTESAPEPAFDLEAIRQDVLGRMDRDLLALGKQEPDRPDPLDDPNLDAEDRAVIEIERDEHRKREDALERENWLLRRAAEHPEAARAFERMLNSEEAEDQFRVLVELFERQSEAAEEPELGDLVGEIDPNNAAPRIPQGTPVTADGLVLDRQFRHDFLRNLGRWPGS